MNPAQLGRKKEVSDEVKVFAYQYGKMSLAKSNRGGESDSPLRVSFNENKTTPDPGMGGRATSEKKRRKNKDPVGTSPRRCQYQKY